MNPKIAYRYARCLLQSQDKSVDLSKTLEDANTIISVYRQSMLFKKSMASPLISATQKTTIIRSIFHDKLQPNTLQFIYFLLNKKRDTLMELIFLSFIEQYNTLKNIHNLKITTAAPVSTELSEDIASPFKKSLKFDSLVIGNEIDNALVGGYKVQIGNYIFDNSIVRKLKTLKTNFT